MIYRFNAIIAGKKPLKFIWNLVTKTIKKEKQRWKPQISYFKTYYKVTILKQVWYWHKDRDTHQRNRIEN